VRTVLQSLEGQDLPANAALDLALAGDAAYRLRIIDRRLSGNPSRQPSLLVLDHCGCVRCFPHGRAAFSINTANCCGQGISMATEKLDLFMALSDHCNVIERNVVPVLTSVQRGSRKAHSGFSNRWPLAGARIFMIFLVLRSYSGESR